MDSHGVARNDNNDTGHFVALKSRKVKRVYENEAIPFDVERGYGVSPFIRVWRLLELVFTHYGYTMINNPFKEHNQLKRLCVLNNTMDTIVKGTIDYADLMPDITVEEFLNGLYAKFGLKYFINGSARTVSFSFIRDILNDSMYEDWTSNKTEPLAISYEDNKQLKMTPNKSIEGTDTERDTREEVIRSHNYEFFDYFGNQPLNRNYSHLWRGENRNDDVRDSVSKLSEILSSDFFSWDKYDNLAYEEIEQKDLSLPMLDMKGSQMMLGYLVGYKHNHSSVSVSGEEISEDEKKAALAFAFGQGKTNRTDIATTIYQPSYASQDNRDFSRNKIAGYDLSCSLHLVE